MRVSSNAFKTTSLPIPFKSPIEIPTIIFSAFFHNDIPLFIILKCKFSKIKQEMFTGIIETLGVIQEIKKENSNIHITMNSITGELQIDKA
jgi:riboflavin synthase